MIHLLQRAAKSIEADGIFATPPPMNKEEGRLHTKIAKLLEREERHEHRDYLNYINKKGAAGAVDAACRARACRWMFQVVRRAGLRREAAVAAIGDLDAFLCSDSPRARKARVFRKEFMLVVVTCLRTNIGAHEPIANEIASSIANLSKGLLSARDIDECERDVLAHRSRGAQAPTALQFLRCIVELFPASLKYGAARRILNDSYRQIEASTVDYASVVLRRSTVAVASVLNSLERMPEDAFAQDERVAFIEKMAGAFHVDVGSPLITMVRRRLIGDSVKRLDTGKARVALAVLGTPPRSARAA